MYETLIDVAQESGGKLPFRTNFILDEFANMPPLKDVDSMVSAARSRDIRFTFIIQNFAQLNDVYGKEVAEIIKGNCGNLIYLISTELAALEEISKMCGEVKSKEKDKTASTPLITVSDLQKLKLFEAIIIRLRKNPFRTKLKPDFEMNWGIDREEEPYPERKIEKIEMFDVKKYVTEERRKQMMSNLENKDPSKDFTNPFANPFGMDSPFSSPFGGMGLPMGDTFSPSMPSKPAMPFSDSPAFNKPIGSLTDQEIDAMMKDIDKRLQELDEEEARSKEKNNATNTINTPVDLPKTVEKDNVINEIKEEPKIEEPKKVEEISNIENTQASSEINDKPKINVDADSIIVNENVVTDDEFFDDFFNE